MVEINGPRAAFFESGNKKYTYRVFKFRGDNFEELCKYGNNFLENLRFDLQAQPDGLLVWRVQPTVLWDWKAERFIWFARFWSSVEPRIPEQDPLEEFK